MLKVNLHKIIIIWEEGHAPFEIFPKNSWFLLEKVEKILKIPWKLIVAKRFNVNEKQKFPKGVKIVWLSVCQRAAYRAKLPFDWFALRSDMLFWDLVVPFEENFKIFRYNLFLNILMDSACSKCQKSQRFCFEKIRVFFCSKRSKKFRKFLEKWLSRSVLMLNKKQNFPRGVKIVWISVRHSVICCSRGPLEFPIDFLFGQSNSLTLSQILIQENLELFSLDF